MTRDFAVDDDAAVQIVKCVGCESFALAADCTTADYTSDRSALTCPRCGTPVQPESLVEFTVADDERDTDDLDCKIGAAMRVFDEISEIEGDYDAGAPERAVIDNIDTYHDEEIQAAIDRLRVEGEIYEPKQGCFRAT